jgi:hypothetical protein
MSRASHDFIGWRLADQGETIPYELALLARFEPTEAERQHAKELEPLAIKYLSGGAV